MALLENITEEELEWMEAYHHPVAVAECLFDDFDNLQFLGEKFGHIRNGQLSMVSYEYLIDEDPTISKKDNFKILSGAGSIYNFGSRKYGKTLVTLIVDILTSILHLEGWNTLFSSYDAVHIRSVLEKIIPISENHDFLKIFKLKVKRSPTYLLRWRNGFVLESVNMNVMSTNPGSQFFGHHTRKHWMEEASKEIEKVYEKRIDAVSEVGCIERFSGMTDFTKYSPPGKIFYNLKNKNWICNFPQYISPMWDDKEKQKSIEKYGGEGSIGFRVFVKGEVVEDGISVFDMERVRRCYNETRKLKNFEISKETFSMFKTKIIVERPKNATNVFICADIGETAPSEIVILFEVNSIYNYHYNITLFNLTDKEQYKIFKWLAQKLKANFIGIDCGDGTGRAIFRSLEEDFNREHLFYYDGSKKIAVGFEKDENDNVVLKNGVPVQTEEFMSEWSVQHLKALLYSERMVVPLDYKFDSQINSVISMQSGNRTVYDCLASEKHLFDAFKVFALTQWENELKNLRPVSKKTFSKTGA